MVVVLCSGCAIIWFDMQIWSFSFMIPRLVTRIGALMLATTVAIEVVGNVSDPE